MRGLIAAALLGAPPLSAQTGGVPATAGDSTRVRMAVVDVPLVQALERLAATRTINLLWQAETLADRAQRRVSCRVDDAPAEAMLRCLTRAVGLDYVRLSTGTYVVIASAAARPATTAFVGAVVDAATGAPVPSARVQLQAAETRLTLSADDGGFRLGALLPGRYDVSVRALGFQPYRTSVLLEPADAGAAGAPDTTSGERPVRVALRRSETVAAPIVVQGIRPGELRPLLETASSTTVEAVRAVVGPSLFLPGAVAPLGTARRDGIGDVHLQGGDIGEHPWRLDGVPLYDAANLSGLLGIVSPSVIDQVRVQRSGFAADVGSFATGVLDLSHAMGGDSTRDVAVAIDPLAATVRAATPWRLGRRRGQLMLAAREGLWGLTAPPALARALRHWSLPDPVLLDRVSGFGALPGMQDLDARTFHTGSGRDDVSQRDLHLAARIPLGLGELSASAFTLTNGLRHDATALDSTGQAVTTSDGFAWRTTGGQLTHRTLLGARVRQQVQLRASSHRLTHDISMAMRGPASATVPLVLAGGEENTITDLSLAPEWRAALTDRVRGVAGFELTRTSARLDLANRVLQPVRARSAPWRGSAFLQATWDAPRALQVETGVRVTQTQQGRSYAEPRLAIRGESQAPGTPWSWRIGGGGYHQFVSQFDVATTMPVALVSSLRFWLPADARTPVAQAWHVASEGVWRPAFGWEVRAEAYSRWHPVLPMLDYGAMYAASGAAAGVSSAAASDTPRPFVVASSGWARGAGVRVVRDARLRGGTWRTEAGVDAAWAARRFPSRFGDRPQAPAWLEPLRSTVASEFTTRYGLRVVARTRAIAQRPWALRQSYYDLFGAAPDGANLPIGMPGRMRRPLLVDTDVGASWTTQWNGRQIEVAASVLNVLDRANVLDYSLRRQADGGYAMVPRLLVRRQPALTMQIR